MRKHTPHLIQGAFSIGSVFGLLSSNSKVVFIAVTDGIGEASRNFIYVYVKKKVFNVATD